MELTDSQNSLLDHIWNIMSAHVRDRDIIMPEAMRQLGGPIGSDDVPL